MGVSYRRLAMPRLDSFRGAGVFYGSVSSEARSLLDMDVYVVGGGNSAGQAAVHLAKYARRVTLVTRGDGLTDTMSRYLVSFLEHANRIEMRPRTIVVNGDGGAACVGLTLEQVDSGDREVVPVDALFVMIGADPHTGWLPPEIARDEHGFLLTGPDIVGAGLPQPWPLQRLPLGLRDQPPRYLCRRRRARGLGQTSRVRGGRGRGGRTARAAALGGCRPAAGRLTAPFDLQAPPGGGVSSPPHREAGLNNSSFSPQSGVDRHA